MKNFLFSFLIQKWFLWLSDTRNRSFCLLEKIDTSSAELFILLFSSTLMLIWQSAWYSCLSKSEMFCLKRTQLRPHIARPPPPLLCTYRSTVRSPCLLIWTFRLDLSEHLLSHSLHENGFSSFSEVMCSVNVSCDPCSFNGSPLLGAQRASIECQKYQIFWIPALTTTLTFSS